MQRADLTWEEAKAHVDGRVGLAGDRRLSLNLKANDVGVPWLLKVANQPDVPASGVLSAMGTVGGTTARPQAMVNVQGAKLVAYGEEFGSLNADVNLTGREVQVSRFTIEKPQPDTPGLITGTGSYHLDRRTYTADLTSENLKLLGLQLPSGETIRGDVQLAAKGMGSVDAPAGAADVTFDGLESGAPAFAKAPAGQARRRGSPGEAAEVTQVGRVVINAVAENKAGDDQGDGRAVQHERRCDRRAGQTVGDQAHGACRESRHRHVARTAGERYLRRAASRHG